MKKNSEKVLDILYRLMDILVIVAILVIIVLILTSRLNPLLKKRDFSMQTQNENSGVKNTLPPSALDNDEKEQKTPNENEPKEGEDKTEDLNTPSEPGATVNEKEPQKPPVETSENKEPSEKKEPPQSEKKEPAPSQSETKTPPAVKKTIKIPDSAGSYEIGKIVSEAGYCESAKEFEKKALELKLDTRLIPGTYEIPEGATLEQIVKIIARKK